MGESIPRWLWMLGALLIVLAFVAGWIFAMRARNNRRGTTPTAPISLFSYNPINVGNDAAARPWENYPATFDVPDDKTRERLHSPPMQKSKDLEEELRGLFFQLQQAWDTVDTEKLKSMLSTNVLESVQRQLEQRQEWLSSKLATNIIVLEAHVLHSNEKDGLRFLTVEFSGVVCATASMASSAPFREIWEVHERYNETKENKLWVISAVQSFH